jgi:hypothetical protein
LDAREAREGLDAREAGFLLEVDFLLEAGFEDDPDSDGMLFFLLTGFLGGTSSKFSKSSESYSMSDPLIFINR